MKNNFEKESRSAALGTVIIVIAMVIVFGAVFAWMYSMELLFLPDFVKNIFGLSGAVGDAGRDSGALSEVVRGENAAEKSSVTFEISYENLKAACLRESAPEGIYLSADVSYYQNGEASVRRIRFWKNGEKFRSETCAVGNPEKIEVIKIGDAEFVTAIDKPGTEFAKIPRALDIAPENEVGIPTVAGLISAIEAFPEYKSDEGALADAALSECDIEMVTLDGTNVYRVTFTYSELDLSEEYCVSLENNIILSCTTVKNGEPIYSYKVIRVSTDPEVWNDGMLYSAAEALKTAEE